MESFHENMIEYKKQLEKGAIKEAYQGLMEYIMNRYGKTRVQTFYVNLRIF